jgi:hypothetical protein
MLIIKRASKLLCGRSPTAVALLGCQGQKPSFISRPLLLWSGNGPGFLWLLGYVIQAQFGNSENLDLSRDMGSSLFNLTCTIANLARVAGQSLAVLMDLLLEDAYNKRGHQNSDLEGRLQ